MVVGVVVVPFQVYIQRVVGAFCFNEHILKADRIRIVGHSVTQNDIFQPQRRFINAVFRVISDIQILEFHSVKHNFRRFDA